VERLNGPNAVLVDDDVTVLKRNSENGVVLGTGSVSGADKEQFLTAWREALDKADLTPADVEFVATATRKEDEPGLLDAAREFDIGIAYLDKETLLEFEGPTPSRSKELIGWPGIAEASAIAAGREHELLVEKRSHDDAVTVAVGR
jgi:cobalt-precorrin 5A hydrolase